MKKILYAICFLISISCSAQVTTNVLSGFNPVNGRPGYKVYDTTRTIYYHTPLYTVGDTVFSSGGGQWTLKGSNIYNNNSGKVGINDSVPTAQLEMATPTNTTTAIDSTGIILSTPFASTSSLFKSPGPITFKPMGWDGTSAAPIQEAYHIYAKGTSGLGGNFPSLFFEASKDGITYFPVFNTVGQSVNLSSTLLGTSALFTGNVVATGYGFNNGTSFNHGNCFNGISGQTAIGIIPTPYQAPETILAAYSTSQVQLMPVLTTIQRDSIGMQVDSLIIVNGGTSYTSNPTWANTGTNNGIGPGGTATASGTGTLTGTSVTGFTITNQGSFIATPAVTGFTGGGGSGATYKLHFKQVLNAGDFFYNSSLNCVQVWNGSRWVSIGLSGTATLSSGTVTVSTSSAKTGVKIFVTCNTPSGTQGFLSVPDASIVSGTSFTINSTNAGDNSTVNWTIQ